MTGDRASEDGRPRILVLVGTRPEVIKLAPVVRGLREREGVDVRVAFSGQHTDLVDQALATFSVELDYDLTDGSDPVWSDGKGGEGEQRRESGSAAPDAGDAADRFRAALTRPDRDLYDLAHALLDGLREVIREVRPDVVVVEGDTATVFFGALVAFLERVGLAHVEAGLRSGEKWSPFPEEIFRRLTDVTADHHFAPTLHAARNLLAEGHPEGSIHVTGNTVVDAVREAARAQEARGAREPELERILGGERDLVLLTAHRRESFGAPLREVFGAVRELVDAAAGAEVLFPVHPNPNVRGPARELLAGHDRIHLVEPLDYLDLVAALRGARLVLTDSGGIQEEAPAFGTPVLVLREVTERPEGVEAGVARLVGTDRDRILDEALPLLRDPEIHAAMARVSNPYGDGRAGERIADILVSTLTGVARTTEDWEGP